MNVLHSTRVLKPSNYSLTGSFKSPKTKKVVEFESSLERDFAFLLEYNWKVESYQHQPLSIVYGTSRKSKRYTPDFLVNFIQGKSPYQLDENPAKSWLVEVKYKADLENNKRVYEEKFNAAKKFVKENNMEFVLISEEIRTHYLENIKFLLPYRYKKLDISYCDFIFESLKKTKSITPNELLSKTGSFELKGRILYTLWILVSMGEISCNLEKKLTMESEIWTSND